MPQFENETLWRQADGTYVRVSAMTETHAKNVLRLLLRERRVISTLRKQRDDAEAQLKALRDALHGLLDYRTTAEREQEAQCDAELNRDRFLD